MLPQTIIIIYVYALSYIQVLLITKLFKINNMKWINKS